MSLSIDSQLIKNQIPYIGKFGAYRLSIPLAALVKRGRTFRGEQSAARKVGSPSGFKEDKSMHGMTGIATGCKIIGYNNIN
jgi:hypothetical protein